MGPFQNYLKINLEFFSRLFNFMDKGKMCCVICSLAVDDKPLPRSFTSIRTKRGPKIESCGAPPVTGARDSTLIIVLSKTCCFRNLQ